MLVHDFGVVGETNAEWKRRAEPKKDTEEHRNRTDMK